MRRKSSMFIGVVALAFAVLGTVFVPAGVIAGKEPPTKTLVQIQEETRHSIVFIRGYAKNPAGELVGRSTGSGFVIPLDGKLAVVSNFHVVTGMDEIWAATAEKGIPQFELKVTGYSPFLDLALLAIEGEHRGLLPATLGDSNALAADEQVYAIGSPLGIRFLAFRGVVTKPDDAPGISTQPSLIISDVKVNPGNSGGPLFTSRGEVVGINTMIAGVNPMTFAIPIDHLKQVLPRLKLGGQMKHAMIGAHIQNSWELAPPDYKSAKVEPPKRLGVVVMQVIADSPAAKAGMKAGDLILEVTLKGTKVTVPDTKSLMKFLMLRTLPDDELTLLVLRGENQYHTMKLRLVERPAAEAGEEASDD